MSRRVFPLVLVMFVASALSASAAVDAAATNRGRSDESHGRLIVPDLRVVPLSETEALVTWTTRNPTDSAVEYDGTIAVFSEFRPAGRYVQAVCYAPEEYGDSLTPGLIDQDLEHIALANANTVNLYGLSSPVLMRADTCGRHRTLEEHLLNTCRSLGLSLIARLEAYPTDMTFARKDAEWVVRNYQPSLKLLKGKYRDRLLYLLVNMPLDDTYVRARFPFWFVPLEQQRAYVRCMRQLLHKTIPGAKFRTIVHYAVVDDIPVAPVSDIADGVALVAYPARCNSSPFTSGLPVVSCGVTPSPGDGPSLEDPANVIIGKDQLDYWLEKARVTNGLPSRRGVAMDGVGFAQLLGHWSGIVSDYRTKVQASRWLAEYLFEDKVTDGFSYFMLHDKAEGPFGILVPDGSASDPAPTTRHEIRLRGLSPGAQYKLRVVQGSRQSQPAYFETRFPCETHPWPRLSVTSPGYGGTVASDPRAFQVRWTSDLAPGTVVSIYADPDDRGLDGALLAEGDVEAGCATVDLSGLRPGGYYLYATASVQDCSAPNGLVWDYSRGRVVIPLKTLSARRTTGPITIDGIPAEMSWSAADWTVFATHPAENDATSARVKLLWDDNYLYAAFDVSDTHVETNALPNTWDSDSVSLWLWAGTPRDDCAQICCFIKESRQGPCAGGSSSPLGNAAWLLKDFTTCNDKNDTDQGYFVEMAIPWTSVHVVPMIGNVISADLLSVDHDYNPGGQYNDPATRFSKIHWDGDDGCWVGGAVILAR